MDSEVLMGQLKANRLEFAFEEKGTNADIVVINTCGFINDAKQESIDTILQYVNAKEKGLIENVYVMGCLSERYKDELNKEIPDIDKYFGVNDIKQIISELGGRYKKEFIRERELTTPGHYAYLKIAEGCNRKCTFCAIPLIRGKHISRPEEEIIDEAKRLVNKGVKEIILISQDLTYYGIDLYKKNNLASLLISLSEIGGLEWIRLHYTYPAGFPEEVLYLMNEKPNICNYIDIPVQHINNRILGLMQRGHSKAETMRLLEKIRKVIPDAALRTTLIIGFPGETQEEYQELVRFVKDFEFDRLGVFAYSPEEGTKAFKLKDDVPEQIKNDRIEQLMGIQQSLSLKLNKNRIGKTFKTLIDRKENEYYVGRTEYDSPEIDNEVLISSPEKPLQIGEFYSVEVSDAEYFDLFGKVSHF